MSTEIKRIKLQNLPIRLGQFLKFTDLAQDGIAAKMLIQAGEVRVNHTIETRRGRQLHAGDQVEAMGFCFQLEGVTSKEKDERT